MAQRRRSAHSTRQSWQDAAPRRHTAAAPGHQQRRSLKTVADNLRLRNREAATTAAAANFPRADGDAARAEGASRVRRRRSAGGVRQGSAVGSDNRERETAVRSARDGDPPETDSHAVRLQPVAKKAQDAVPSGQALGQHRAAVASGQADHDQTRGECHAPASATAAPDGAVAFDRRHTSRDR